MITKLHLLSSSERALYSGDKFRTVLVGSYTDPIIAQIIKPDNEKIAESNNLTKRVEIVSSDKIGWIAGCLTALSKNYTLL
jgi:hypothetical protein